MSRTGGASSPAPRARHSPRRDAREQCPCSPPPDGARPARGGDSRGEPTPATPCHGPRGAPRRLCQSPWRRHGRIEQAATTATDGNQETSRGTSSWRRGEAAPLRRRPRDPPRRRHSPGHRRGRAGSLAADHSRLHRRCRRRSPPPFPTPGSRRLTTRYHVRHSSCSSKAAVLGVLRWCRHGQLVFAHSRERSAPAVSGRTVIVLVPRHARSPRRNAAELRPFALTAEDDRIIAVVGRSIAIRYQVVTSARGSGTSSNHARAHLPQRHDRPFACSTRTRESREPSGPEETRRGRARGSPLLTQVTGPRPKSRLDLAPSRKSSAITSYGRSGASVMSSSVVQAFVSCVAPPESRRRRPEELQCEARRPMSRSRRKSLIGCCRRGRARKGGALRSSLVQPRALLCGGQR